MKGPIIITGGGTGGHVFPMQAIGEELLARSIPSQQLRYVGSRRGQEATLLAGGAIALTLLPGRGLQRSFAPRALLVNCGAATRLLWSLFVAIWKIGQWRPSTVISVGGYASFAVSFAAVMWRRPLVLVDFDATPGAVHRALARFATTRCTAFPSDDPRAVFTGAPLRHAITAIDRSASSRARARLRAVPPIDANRTVIVVMTGSLGARKVNRAVSALAQQWASRNDITIVHVSGRRDFEEVANNAPELRGLDYRIVPFANMVELWQWCDLALCRAGAMTIGELTALAIPALLVPLPGAPGDHQTVNARSLVEHGAARMLPDAECDAPHLARALEEMMVQPTRDAMSSASRALGHLDATSRIVDVLLEVAA